ncbi:MAG: ribbon-helix-helix protein, CopG family [Candidatus Wallbacteria bacterium]|nr:ribbon-helix-helix protein, CopG family [Candidatus Wallbacteria bacterium]
MAFARQLYLLPLTVTGISVILGMKSIILSEDIINTRLTISIPESLFAKLEREKKKRRISRSDLLCRMIDFFFRMEKKSAEDERYQAGYRKTPEKIREIEALEKLQSTVMDEF